MRQIKAVWLAVFGCIDASGVHYTDTDTNTDTEAYDVIANSPLVVVVLDVWILWK